MPGCFDLAVRCQVSVKQPVAQLVLAHVLSEHESKGPRREGRVPGHPCLAWVVSTEKPAAMPYPPETPPKRV